jgi:2-phospho-L-lactate guanylyltransferase
LTWTAVIPFKGRGERKTRLAGFLKPEERQALSERLFRHVAGVLGSVPQIDDVVVLSDVRPPGWTGRLALDEGRGLNGELGALAAGLGAGPLLIVHADLPLIGPGDIEALLSGALGGVGIAPDRHGEGTNALALRYPTGFDFAFGPGSFARHQAEAKGLAQVVVRQGLGLDIDIPEDLTAAAAAGFIV